MAPFIKEAKVNFWLIYLVNIMQEMTKNPWQTSYTVSIYLYAGSGELFLSYTGILQQYSNQMTI